MMENPTIEDFILEAEERWRPVLWSLRTLMFQQLPEGAQELLRHKIPFYYYKGPLCYLNPRKTHLDLGFYRGASLSNEQSLLCGDGKLVRHIRFAPHDAQRAFSQEVLEVLHEAILLNEWHAEQKKKSKTKK